MVHKAGFINIIGNPNVGKSTLMNALVGEKLSIITSKAQTTRHRILGILNNEDFQIIFSDTPGLLKPKYLLQESMLKFAKSAMKDADILVYVTDIFEDYENDSEILKKIQLTKIPVLLLINKVDLGNKDKCEETEKKWKELLPNAEIHLISALKGNNIIEVYKRMLDMLPEHPPYYPKDALTDKPERFFVSEIIREKILKQYKKEIPYSCEIDVEDFKEEEKIIRIRAIIYVERETQKGIIIGHKGGAIKKVGIESRIDIEAFFNKKVYIELSVKVNKDWRNKASTLKRFGY